MKGILREAMRECGAIPACDSAVEAQCDCRYVALGPPLRYSTVKVISDQAELLQGSFQIVHDFLGNDIGIGKVVGSFEGVVLQPKDVKTGFVTGNQFVIIIGAPTAVWFFSDQVGLRSWRFAGV